MIYCRYKNVIRIDSNRSIPNDTTYFIRMIKHIEIRACTDFGILHFIVNPCFRCAHSEIISFTWLLDWQSQALCTYSILSFRWTVTYFPDNFTTENSTSDRLSGNLHLNVVLTLHIALARPRNIYLFKLEPTIIFRFGLNFVFEHTTNERTKRIHPIKVENQATGEITVVGQCAF